MFGIGAQEMVIIGLLFLVIFGPNKLPQMARDFGRFVNEARRSIDEFKDELTSSAEDDEDEEEERKKRERRRLRRANAQTNPQKNGEEEEHDL